MSRHPTSRRKWKKKHRHSDPRRLSETAGARLQVRQVRSGIGQPDVRRRTLAALGLRHHQDVVIHRNHAAVRGMLYEVRHLVQVTPLKEGE
jgi:large subunit ribosomal protein L30